MLDISKAIYYMEDFKMFKKVQLTKYNKVKKQEVSDNSPEFDMIIDLIKDYWCDLLSTGYLNDKSLSEKNKIFYSIEIIFPYSNIPALWSDGITYVDFASY